MSQAKQSGILRDAQNEYEARDEGRRKIKRLHLRSLTDGGDVERTNQNTIHYLKIVTFLATRNTDNSIEHRK